MALPQAGRAGDHAPRSARPADRVREAAAGMPRVISVGRLDLTSEGLLLLTNDGALARSWNLPHRLAAPLPRAGARHSPTSGGSQRWPRVSPSTASPTAPIEAGLEFAEGRQCLAHRQPARGPQPRGAARHGASRADGDAADPHCLWAVPARHAAARRGGGSAGPRPPRPVAAGQDGVGQRRHRPARLTGGAEHDELDVA